MPTASRAIFVRVLNRPSGGGSLSIYGQSTERLSFVREKTLAPRDPGKYGGAGGVILFQEDFYSLCGKRKTYVLLLIVNV